jgi:hypothetical protein
VTAALLFLIGAAVGLIAGCLLTWLALLPDLKDD